MRHIVNLSIRARKVVAFGYRELRRRGGYWNLDMRPRARALTMKHVQQRDNRWCIVDLVGKHGRVRTIPMPTWTKNAIDAWTVVATITEGNLFRPVNRGDQVCGERMSEKVVWQMLKTYVAGAGLPDIAPHDLRRTTAKLCRAAGGELSGDV